MVIPMVIIMLTSSLVVTMEGQENQQDRYDKHHHIWNENGHPNIIYRQNRQPENIYQDNGHRHQDNRHGLLDIRRGHEYHDCQDIGKASHGIYSKKIY